MTRGVPCGVICVLALLLVGCGKVEESAGGKKGSVSWNADELPEYVEKQLDEKLYVDAKVHTQLDGPLYSYEAKPDLPDEKELQDIFFEEGEQVRAEADPKIKSYSCESQDGKKRAYGNDAIVFYRMEDIDYYALLSSCGGVYHMFPETLAMDGTEAELGFMSSEEAKGIVRETAEKMGVSLAEEPYVFYALDEAALMGLYDEISAEWSEEVIETYLPGVDFAGDQGCYYMVWQEVCPRGEVLMSGNFDTGSVAGVRYTMGVYVMAVVNENGLVTVFSNTRYEFLEEQEIQGELISIDEALEQVRAQYENVILPEEICICDITLEYVAVLEDFDDISYRIIPAWCMRTTDDNYRMYVVDAVRGELL